MDTIRAKVEDLIAAAEAPPEIRLGDDLVMVAQVVSEYVKGLRASDAALAARVQALEAALDFSVGQRLDTIEAKLDGASVSSGFTVEERLAMIEARLALGGE